MEAVVFEDSPLATYLEGKFSHHDVFSHTTLLIRSSGEGGGKEGWAPASDHDASSALPSSSFAPRGRPTVQSKFRNKLPPPLRINIPQHTAVAAIHNTCSVRADLLKYLCCMSWSDCPPRKPLTRGLDEPTIRGSSNNFGTLSSHHNCLASTRTMVMRRNRMGLSLRLQYRSLVPSL
jgi:hypothetical protein